MKKSLTALTLVFALVGYAYAEDGGDGGGQLEYVAYAPTIDQVAGHSMSCTEARATAWFERELKRSDGDVNPEEQYVPCGSSEIVAQANADRD